MAGRSRLKDGVASARLCPAIHVFLLCRRSRTWMPGTSSAKTRFALLPGHDAVSLAEKLPVDAVPVQCADDARDPDAYAVRPRAPRHVRRSPGHGPSGAGAHAPGSGPMHPGRPGGPGPCRLAPGRLGLAIGLGLDDCGPLDIFWCFRSFRAFRCIGSPGRRRSGLRLAAGQRQAPIASLSCGGCQNEPCDENEFTHVVSPLEVEAETMPGRRYPM